MKILIFFTATFSSMTIDLRWIITVMQTLVILRFHPHCDTVKDLLD